MRKKSGIHLGRKLPTLVAAFSLAACAAAQNHPAFKDYAVSVSSQSLEQVRLETHPDARMFSTRLNHLVGKRANFAGDSLIAYWGCGTACQMMAVVNVLTGEVQIPEDVVGTNGFCFHPDSRLLVVNPLGKWQDANDHYRFQTVFYVWDGQLFQRIVETAPTKVSPDCEP